MGILFIIIIVLLKIILYTFLILLGILLLLLLLPVSYDGFFQFEEDPYGRIKVGWPWGFFSVESEFGADGKSYFCILGKRLVKLKKKEKLKKEKEKKKKPEESEEIKENEGKKKSIYTFTYIKELIDMGLIKDVFEFLEKLLNRILPKEIRVNLQLGLGDPSYTGYLYGAYASVPLLRNRWNIYLEPNFTEEEFEINGFIYGRVQLISILILVIKLLLKKSVRKIIKDRRRSKKDGKEKSSK